MVTLRRMLKPSQVKKDIYPEGQTPVGYHYLNRLRRTTMWKGNWMRKAPALIRVGFQSPSKVLKTFTKRANWHEMLGPKQGKEGIYAGCPVW